MWRHIHLYQISIRAGEMMWCWNRFVVKFCENLNTSSVFSPDGVLYWCTQFNIHIHIIANFYYGQLILRHYVIFHLQTCQLTEKCTLHSKWAASVSNLICPNMVLVKKYFANLPFRNLKNAVSTQKKSGFPFQMNNQSIHNFKP